MRILKGPCVPMSSNATFEDHAPRRATFMCYRWRLINCATMALQKDLPFITCSTAAEPAIWERITKLTCKMPILCLARSVLGPNRKLARCPTKQLLPPSATRETLNIRVATSVLSTTSSRINDRSTCRMGQTHR